MVKDDKEIKKIIENILLSMSKEELIEFARKHRDTPREEDIEDYKWDRWEYNYD